MLYILLEVRAVKLTSRLPGFVLTLSRNANILCGISADMGSGTPLDHPSYLCPQTSVALFVYITSLSVFKTTQQTVEVSRVIVLCMDGSLSSD